ncbi:QueT transporter family protein [Allofustis seminis]|uniref:QueT transporter family protein n=1 Tax=Allofustis seminis TaxID=166939 RepID=UPI0003618C78|nr:QueT transporter family protein [Allofustis seminis]
MKLSTRQLVINALFAAVYIVITIFLPSYGSLQLRLSEMFAHLPLFNKKYAYGLLLGVAIANFQSGFGVYDVIFGTLHSAISLLIVFLLTKKIKSMSKKLVLNSMIFAAMSFIVAGMIAYLTQDWVAFWVIYASIAASIAIVMLATAPIILALDKHIHFRQLMMK